VRDKTIHEWRELSFHHLGLAGGASSRCGDRLRGSGEIVGANFFGAVAGFDLTAAFGGERGLPLLLLLFVQARAEHAHGFRTILDLRFFHPAATRPVAGDMRDADGG